MSELTQEQDEKLGLMLQALEPETKIMSESARGFVRDQIERHQKYGRTTRMSPKQWAWLERLYTEHVGDLDALGGAQPTPAPAPPPMYDNKANSDDDEIPF